MSARLEARNIALPGRLAPCDVTLAGGELAMLVGPNGAGKTSLLHAMAGIGETEGEVRIDGARLSTLPPSRRRDLLAYLGAGRDVRWPLTVRDFVGLGVAGDRDGAVERALQAACVERFAERRIDRLSTGERSRAMLARVLASDAGVLLLDEPCANLDPKWQLHAIETLKRQSAAGKAALLSIHDLDLALGHADRIIVVDDGRIVSDGAPADSLTDSVVANVFGVRRSLSGRWQAV